MILTIHWAKWVYDHDLVTVEWVECSFDRLEPVIRSESVAHRCSRGPATSVVCNVPTGSKVVRDETGQSRLKCYLSSLGLEAGTVARACHFRQNGFRVLDQVEVTEMARRRNRDEPLLFADADEPVAIGAYNQRIEPTAEALPFRPIDRASLRPVVAELAAEVIAPERRRVERAIRAVERAIECLGPKGEGVPEDRVKLALAILRECLIPDPEDVPCQTI